MNQKVYCKKQKEIQKQRKQLKLKEKQNQSRKSPKECDLEVGMELLENYSEEDKMNIMANLNVVQTRGWSAQIDQFHIIQKLKDYKDLKERLSMEKENNDDLENDLKQKDEEINLLKMHIKAKSK